jgi:predicted Ser/Thr protein kinase
MRLVKSLEGFKKRAQAHLFQVELQNKETRRRLKERRALEAQIARMEAEMKIFEERKMTLQYELEGEKIRQELDALLEESHALQRKEASNMKWLARQKLRDARRKKLMANLALDDELQKFDKQTSLHSHFQYAWQETGDF